ncbi:hypothetical protein Tco_1080961 [Tanacetum coccineum]|uniref:Uncharacterized protein n=1 Tax=Tanacetum coccineum TaxID=301880 RepID=A0ABQ5HW78_9ASTR
MTSSSKTNSPNYKRKTARISVKSPTYVNLESSSKEHQHERTPSPPPRKKSLSPPHAPSKSTSSRSTYQTTSSSPSESPAPTHVALPQKLRFVIPMKLESQKLPLQHTPPHSILVSTVDNWQPGPSNPSPPPRVSNQPTEFEHPSSPQPLFVNINNNVPQLENLPPNLGNQQFSNPPNNILDFIHPNDMPHPQHHKGVAFSQEDAWAVLRFHPKWDAPEQVDLTGDVPGATQEDLFGHDARPRPAGKPRPAKKTKSDATASTGGSSASTQFGELMEQELRLKREAAERAFEAQAEKDSTLMRLE